MSQIFESDKLSAYDEVLCSMYKTRPVLSIRSQSKNALKQVSRDYAHKTAAVQLDETAATMDI